MQADEHKDVVFMCVFKSPVTWKVCEGIFAAVRLCDGAPELLENVV